MPENRGVSALASLWCGGALLVLASVGAAQEAQYPRKGNIEITVLWPAVIRFRRITPEATSYTKM